MLNRKLQLLIPNYDSHHGGQHRSSQCPLWIGRNCRPQPTAPYVSEFTRRTQHTRHWLEQGFPYTQEKRWCKVSIGSVCWFPMARWSLLIANAGWWTTHPLHVTEEHVLFPWRLHILVEPSRGLMKQTLKRSKEVHCVPRTGGIFPLIRKKNWGQMKAQPSNSL